jgi:hypothetical protein
VAVSNQNPKFGVSMKFQQPPIIKRVFTAVLKTLGILVSLYLFIVSLTFLSTSFRCQIL